MKSESTDTADPDTVAKIPPPPPLTPLSPSRRRSTDRCMFTSAAPAKSSKDAVIQCNRRAVWEAGGVGKLCAWHFEWCVQHRENMIFGSITRLSENDRDFVIKTAPGQGHNAYTASAAAKAEQSRGRERTQSKRRQ